MSSIILIYFSLSCSGGISSAALNPTVAFANITFVAMIGNKHYLSYLPSYFFGCLFGGIFAALFCKYVAMEVVSSIPQNNDLKKMNKVHENLNYSFASLSEDNTKSLMASIKRNEEENTQIDARAYSEAFELK